MALKMVWIIGTAIVRAPILILREARTGIIGVTFLTARHSVNRFLLGVLIASSLSLIVIAAISANALPELIFGVVALGLISIGLATVGVNLFGRWSEAQWKRDNLKLSHIENMADKGLIVTGRGVPTYIALAAPDTEDIPVSTQGITASTVAPYRQDALNLLALSKQVMGANSLQVVPYYKARKNDYFKDVAIWTGAVQFLLISQLAIERYDGKRKLGTFVNHGTVGQIYERMSKSASSPLLK
jgi:hypothetical protein